MGCDELERAELYNDETGSDDEEPERVVCEPVWTVVAREGVGELGRREVIPGVNAVAGWREERELARWLAGRSPES